MAMSLVAISGMNVPTKKESKLMPNPSCLSLKTQLLFADFL